jgi:hypothetical protein
METKGKAAQAKRARKIFRCSGALFRCSIPALYCGALDRLLLKSVNMPRDAGVSVKPPLDLLHQSLLGPT